MEALEDIFFTTLIMFGRISLQPNISLRKTLEDLGCILISIGYCQLRKELQKPTILYRFLGKTLTNDLIITLNVALLMFDIYGVKQKRLKESYDHLSIEIFKSQRRAPQQSYYDASEKIKTLIASGVDVNEKDEHGFTPLHRAVFYDALEAVKLLLQANANVNEIDSDGRTPLHFTWSREVGQLLLEYKAEINAKDGKKRTPLHLVTSASTAILFLKNGADILAKDDSGEIPLTVFSRFGDEDRNTVRRILFPYNYYDSLRLLIREINQSLETAKILAKATLLENPSTGIPPIFNNPNDDGESYWNSHSTEIRNMMDEKIPGGYYSYHSFCKEKDLKQLGNVITQQDINRFNQVNLNEKFPNYSMELKSQLKKLTTIKEERNKLLSLAKKCTISSVENGISLTNDCQQLIFSYLSNKLICHILKASLNTSYYANDHRTKTKGQFTTTFFTLFNTNKINRLDSRRIAPPANSLYNYSFNRG